MKRNRLLGRRPSFGVSSLALALAVAPALAACSVETSEVDAESAAASLTEAETRAVALRFAPVFFQDTDDTMYKGDYLTKMNFDGDYNGKNNWDNLGNYSTVPAHIYYSVSETTTHYFIGYFTFHPRDWSDSGVGQHENDLEGVTLAVRKNAAGGAVVAMETQAHGFFSQYAIAGTASGSDDVEGPLTFEGGTHPRVFIEAKGHGVYGCDDRCTSAPGGDGIVYYGGGAAQSPTGGNGNWSRRYSYGLIAMDAPASQGDRGFWDLRNDICDTCTFAEWGKIRGEKFGVNKASAPWAWDDSLDGATFAGDVFCDPAKFFDVHLNGTPFDTGFSHAYVDHRYRTHSLRIDAVRSDKDRDSFGGASDIFVHATATGSPAGVDDLLGEDAWKRDGANVDTWYPFRYGGDDAVGEKKFGSVVNTHSFCRQGASTVRLDVRDSDTGGDDAMGTISVSTSGYRDVDLGDARLRFSLTRH